MRKTLLGCNLVFLGIQNLFTLWWLGFQYGRWQTGLLDGAVFLIVPLVFLGIHIGLYNEWEYVKVKSLGIVGGLVLAWAVILFGLCISIDAYTEDYVYLITMIVLSVLSSFFCFVCIFEE